MKRKSNKIIDSTVLLGPPFPQFPYFYMGNKQAFKLEYGLL